MATGGHVRGLVLLLICSLVLFAAGAAAQVPVVPQGGVVNGASFRPANASGGGVAAGSIVSIFGSNLASATVAATSLPLPTTLGGTSVRIGGIVAPLFFVSAGQINAQVPWAVAAGTNTVTVAALGGSSIPANVTVQDSAPGLFSQTSDGRGPGAVLNYVPEQKVYAINTPGATINPSGIVTIYGTGFGRVTNPPADGVAAGATTQTTVATPVVMIGGRQATIQSSGLAPNYVGLYQINAVIPTGTPEGCYLPVTVAFGSNVSNAVTIGVTNNRVNCSVATSGSTGLFIGGSFGYAAFSKITTQIPFVNPALMPQPADRIDAFFRRYQTRTPTSLALYPPVGGGCNIWLFRADSAPTDTSVTTDIGLNAGTLTLSGTGFRQPLSSKQTGEYGLELGQNVIQAGGVWTLTGSGGTDVGAFTVTETIPSLLFTMRDFGTVSGVFSQSSPLNLSWTCPDTGDPVGVEVASFNLDTKLMGMAFCSFLCGNGTGQVSADVLKQLPLSGQSAASIIAFYTPNPAKIPAIKATGLTQGAFGLVITSTLSGAQMVQ
jgi:uncharacterized protein (TIGR03437 family)